MKKSIANDVPVRSVLWQIALAVVLASTAATSARVCRASEPAPLAAYRYAELHMGTAFKLTVYASCEDDADEAAKAVFERIEQLDARLSHYRDDSELSKLCRTSSQWVAVSDELWLMLSRSVQLSKQTGGAFDVTVGPMVQLWRRSRRRKQLPSDELLRDARQRVGYRLIELDEDEQRVRLKKPDMRIDLGAIAKGYAADEALRVLAKHGLRHALIDAGGDLVAGDPPPGKTAWTLAVATAGAKTKEGLPLLSIAGAAAATSGDRFQFVEIGGTRYSHIIDPRTGLGITTPSSVTVIAADGMTADALASAVSVLGPEAGMKLIDAIPGTAALIVQQDRGRAKTFRSKRFEKWLKPEGH